MGRKRERPRERLRRWMHAEIAWLVPARRLRLRLATSAIERWLVDRPGAAVLDAGCQTGLLALHLAQRHPTWAVTAVDLDPGAIGTLERDAAAAGVVNLEARRADLTRPLGEERYDAVAAIECLSEIPDDAAVLRNLADVLAPGGVLVLHVPLAGWRPVLRSSPRQWHQNLRPGYAADDLCRDVEAVGLTVISCATTTRTPVHLAEEVRHRWVRRAPRRAQLLFAPVAWLVVWLELRGLAFGDGRGVLVLASRPASA